MNTNEPTLLDVIDGDRSKRYLMLAPFGIGVRLRSAGIDPDMPVTRLRADLEIAAAVRSADTQYAVLYNLLNDAQLTELFGDEQHRSNP